VPSATDSSRPRGGGDVDEREVARVARSAALNCYGVTAVTGGRWYERLAAGLGIGKRGVRVHSATRLEVALDLEVALSVPRDKVVANVREAVEYAVQRELGRSIDQLTLTVVER
jgi:uncharacterized alkaline shock family protein YloU